MNKLLFLVTIFIVSFLSSCEIINPAEDIPSYIQIDTIDFQSQSSDFGTSSHKITDCWVYVNRDFIGCFELPAKIPVLKSGNCEVMIRGGIKLNGIAASRIVNPFYSNFKVNKNLKIGEVIKIDSVILNYNSINNIIWKEDFENNVLSIKRSNKGDSVRPCKYDLLKITNDLKIGYSNNKSGIVSFLDTSYFEAITKDAYILPKSLDDVVLLEMNYCTNQSFEVGVSPNNGVESSTRYPLLIINSSGMKWNKIYINLSNAVESFSDVSKFNIYFAATKRKIENQSDSTILRFDNIKLFKL